jgi:hypothetical protein
MGGADALQCSWVQRDYLASGTLGRWGGLLLGLGTLGRRWGCLHLGLVDAGVAGGRWRRPKRSHAPGWPGECVVRGPLWDVEIFLVGGVLAGVLVGRLGIF